MDESTEKRGSKNKKLNIAIILAIIVIVALTLFIVKKPSITGFVVITKETTFSDNLNLVINESKKVTWSPRNPGNLKLIRATGAISRNGSAKVYIEKDDEKLLIFDSTKQLFDINVEVLPDYKKIFQGDELLIQIILFNLRGFGSVDVNVKYSIKDTNGNIIATEEEVVAVETQAKFVRKLLIPSDLKSGTYVAFIEVKTPDGLIGTSSDIFEVTSRFEEEYSRQFIFVVLGLAVVIILTIIIILSLNLFKKAKERERVIELKGKIPSEKVQKLEKELTALESAYKSKFISEESYKKNMERIEKRLQKLKSKQTKNLPIEIKKENQTKIKNEEKEVQKPNKTEEKTAEEIVDEVKREDEKDNK